MRIMATTALIGAGLLSADQARAQLPYTSTTAVPWHLERSYEVRENLELNGDTIALQTSGTGVVWDFTPLQVFDAPAETWFFEPASATPYHSYYPSANFAAWYTSPLGNEEYLYFNNSPFELRLIDGVLVENGVPEPIDLCPDPFLIMDYPMNIGSGVQHEYDCPDEQQAIQNWVILATGSVMYEGGTIDDLVMWRSTYSTGGYDHVQYFWTQGDNVLYPVVRYNPGASLIIRRPVSETVLNVDDTTEKGRFMLFPNPVHSSITMRTASVIGTANAYLIDATGREIGHLGTIAPQSGDRQFDVSGLSSGSYVIELRSDAGIISRELFVKQ